MGTLGERLREERKRLGLGQDEFAVAGGVQRRAQGNYERDERNPDAGYLAGIAKCGADILYIVTGNRAVSEADIAAEITRYADAWQTLDAALSKFKRTLEPSKKRKAVDALYRASRGQTAIDEQQLALVLDLAA